MSMEKRKIQNTFLPRAVMTQVASSLSNVGIKDVLVYGGILPLQSTNANIVAGHQEEVCTLLAPVYGRYGY